MSKKIFKEDLVHIGKNIIWNKNIGNSIRFVYDDIEDKIKIIDYDCTKKILTVLYKGEKSNITITGFKQGNLGRVLHFSTTKYKYNINDIIVNKGNNIKILKQIKMKNGNNFCKGYVCKCLNDNYSWKITEYNLLRGDGCPVCNSREASIGVNNIDIVAPWMEDWAVNLDDIKNLLPQSNKKIECKCPVCGTQIGLKKIQDIFYKKISCPRCSDGISYPEKFMYNLLQQLKIDFIYQYYPKWCKYKFKDKMKTGRYDFYISSKQLIIEMDGGMGHGNYDNKMNGQTKKESKSIDDYKDQLARKHSIEPIRIDCNYKDNNKFIYIRENIIKSKLSQIYNLSNINWEKINIESQKTLIKSVCDYKNEHSNMSNSNIAKIFYVNPSTIGRYLKRGCEVGWYVYK